MFTVTRVETIYGATDVIVIYRHIFYRNDDGICNACQNCDTQVGRYAHYRLIGDRTWTGIQDDMSVGDFVQHISDDVMSTYETTVAENIAVKYYLEIAVDF